jgi:hypothetical protein
MRERGDTGGIIGAGVLGRGAGHNDSELQEEEEEYFAVCSTTGAGWRRSVCVERWRREGWAGY